MTCGQWDPLLDRICLTLTCAQAFRAAGRKIRSRGVVEAAEAFRYAHKLETAEAMGQWLHYWRLTPERWRQAILLQAVQARLADMDKASLAKSLRPKEPQIVHWLRPLGAVSGAFQELAKSFAGHASIYDSLQKGTEDPNWSTVLEDSPLPPAGGRGQGEGGEESKPPTNHGEDAPASAAIYLGLAAEEVRGITEHLLAIDRSVERYREAIATPDAIRRQITANVMGLTQVGYDVLTFVSAPAAREAADCIRLDGDSPQEVADRAGIAMEQATRFCGDLEKPLAAVLLSAAGNLWIGPVQIADRHQLFRISSKIPPRPDDAKVVDRIAAHLFNQAMDKERERVRWRWQF
jgi:hypothetical protein